MGSFWSAVKRMFRAVFFFGGSKATNAADAMYQNPDVMKGSYDSIIKQKQNLLEERRQAVTSLVSSQETKKQRLQDLTKEIEQKEKLKAGSQAMAKGILDKLGGDLEKAKLDSKFVLCQQSFKDFNTQLERLHSDATELDKSIQVQQTTINGHQAGLQSALREVTSLKDEKNDAVADVIANKEEERAANLLNGIANDTTSDDLRTMRDARSKAKAGAATARQMAGLDVASSNAEFINALGSQSADDEFLKGLGVKTATTEPVTATPEPAKVPEV